MFVCCLQYCFVECHLCFVECHLGLAHFSLLSPPMSRLGAETRACQISALWPFIAIFLPGEETVSAAPNATSEISGYFYHLVQEGS